MSPVSDAYGSSSGAGNVIAIVERESERARAERAWQQLMGRCFWTGTAGVVQVEKQQKAEVVFLRATSYDLRRIGSSPMFRDERVLHQPSAEAAPEPPRTTTRHAVLRMSSADQALEAMAALNLNKTQFAEVLGVSRPTLYDWLDGKEPNVANARRLTSLLKLLADAGVTAADSLSPRFVREALNDGEPSLLDLLKDDTLDEARVAKLLAEARALEGEAEGARLAREDRLRALGYELPTEEQRRQNLGLNVALREWPKE
jgi:transcriptional regulator with XRE-family HTH domain